MRWSLSRHALALTAGLLLGSTGGCVRSVTVNYPDARLDLDTADRLLRPGDMLFRWVDPSDPLSSQVTNAIIQGGQVTAETMHGAVRATEAAVRDLLRQDQDRFAHALTHGDPNAVHVAIYLGGGVTAEAFGTNLDDPRVRVWPLFADYRRPAAWRVLRHRDPRVRAAVATVARRWASGRMAYAVPLDVFVEDTRWGDDARQRALSFARAFDAEGGPPETTRMFCSQFAVAVLQSATARVHLPRATQPAELDALPPEARLDAVASPLRVYGEWLQSGAFEPVAHVVVR